jgi:hypothetical protein
MHGNVPVRFGRGRLDSLATKGLAAYLIAVRSSRHELAQLPQLGHNPTNFQVFFRHKSLFIRMTKAIKPM